MHSIAIFEFLHYSMDITAYMTTFLAARVYYNKKVIFMTLLCRMIRMQIIYPVVLV